MWAKLDAYVSSLLGEEWELERAKALEQEEVYNSLTMKDKKEVIRFIDSRYKHYDEQSGSDTGDKYSETIWEETSEKFNLSGYLITSIYNNIEVISEIGRENLNNSKVAGDAVLNFKDGSSIIAIDEESLDSFMNALAENDEEKVENLYNKNKISEVPKGTPVNILDKKLLIAKVKILDGLYKDNEVWVLIESLPNE